MKASMVWLHRAEADRLYGSNASNRMADLNSGCGAVVSDLREQYRNAIQGLASVSIPPDVIVAASGLSDAAKQRLTARMNRVVWHNVSGMEPVVMPKAEQSFRAREGLDAPTEITSDDAEAFGRALGFRRG